MFHIDPFLFEKKERIKEMYFMTLLSAQEII